MDSKRKWSCLSTNLEPQAINGKRTKSEPLETKFHQEVDMGMFLFLFLKNFHIWWDRISGHF